MLSRTLHGFSILIERFQYSRGLHIHCLSNPTTVAKVLSNENWKGVELTPHRNITPVSQGGPPPVDRLGWKMSKRLAHDSATLQGEMCKKTG